MTYNITESKSLVRRWCYAYYGLCIYMGHKVALVDHDQQTTL